ncbi:MAG: carbohydrate porin [Geobacteraceae bacterium]|nr:carbohydrate porin [Geobacteraceae bacterium]
MKSSNVLAALVTLGLATAAAAPAMALENQFSGSFTSFYDLSNYSAVYGQKDPVNDAPTENYFVQRARLGYTAKASDSVKLVTLFELDYSFLGNSSYTTGRNTGGALGADSVNIETKNIFLELDYPMLNTRIGMQGVDDAFKGSIFSADMAGIKVGHSYTNASVAAGFFRWNDSADSGALGKSVNDMFMLDAKYNANKETKVGAAYYYIVDDRAASNNAKVHSLGLNAEGMIGPLTLNGFAVKQFGDINATTKAKGYELNAGAKYNLGAAGTLRSELLYTSGGNNAFYNADSGNEGGGFYDNEMVILGRDKNALTLDAAIVFDGANRGQGVIFFSLGYDYTFSNKLSASANAGFAAVTKNTLGASNSDYLGTEINAETNYKLTPNVTLGARAGYVVLGDYFSAGEDNPYDVKLLAKFSF